MGDNGLAQLSAGFLQCGSAAEISCIGFYQVGVEVVLADGHAQPVPQFGLPVARSVLMRRLYGLVLFPRGTGRTGKPAQLLDRTQPDSVSLAQGAIDGPGFCHAHLGATDHWRSICGVGITVADESLRRRALEDSCLENPPTGCNIGKAFL